MYYSNGNYEAFARPEKPEGIEKKHAVIIGGGLAGLAAACFLVRDAQMPGENITVMEDMPVAGGRLRRYPEHRQGLYHPRRPRDGKPL